MIVASIELCRELYELSGWEYEEKWWSHAESDSEFFSTDAEDEADFIAPAYDLGYLLRKLPETLEFDWQGLPNEGNLSRLMYEHRFDGHIFFYHLLRDEAWAYKPVLAGRSGHESPEDAACKLVIELFKQGILKREAA